MLQKFILDDSPSISVRLAPPQKFHQTYSAETSRQFSYRASKFPSTSNHMKTLLKTKGKLRKYSTCLSKLSGKNESESEAKCCEIQACYDILSSATCISRNILRPKSYGKSGELGCKSKGASDCLPSYGQGTHKHSLDDQPTLLNKLNTIYFHLLASEKWNSSQLKLCHRNYLVSAINLTHYLALHCRDNEQLKEGISSIGIPNVEPINACILASIRVRIQLLENLICKNVSSKENISSVDRIGYITTQESENLEGLTVSTMKEKVSLHAKTLFGPVKGKKSPYIMVTVGREAILNKVLLHDLLKAGMNVVRINCAHDDRSVWSEIIRMTKHSSQMLEKPCRILMDLAGPKLRTGPLMIDPNVIKISPKKDAVGNIIPALGWLCCAGSSPPAQVSPDATLFLDENFLSKLKVRDVLRFIDVRGRKRSLKLIMQSSLYPSSGFIVQSSRTAYVALGTRFHVKKNNRSDIVGEVVKMPSLEQYIWLKVGDLLTICRTSGQSVDRLRAEAFGSTRITCSSDHIFESVKPGEPIAFDDGKIWGKIQGRSTNEITILITHASPYGSKLGIGKSINIPKSKIQFKGPTPKDFIDLEFVAANADMVGISFIRDVDDMIVIQNELQKQQFNKLGVVLKVETRDAFEKLPLLLFQAMQSSNPIGVMIARGDLMVECGWENLGDIQEEILSICDAAHIPVIWATQVLDSFVKHGLPTRAEMTDLAAGMRANCIMLNKGEHIVEAVSAIESIISRHLEE